MIYGIFHKGSGLGNQLHRYVGTRILSETQGETHSMIAPDLFKGKEFITLDMAPNDIPYIIEEPSGRVVPAVTEGVIDGEFQHPKDFLHRLDDIRKWITCTPKPFPIPFAKPEDICVINFRGGDYVGLPELFLPKVYWERAIAHMREFNPRMKFGVVTDDIATAQEFFPNLPIYHDMHGDWSAIREAHYLILSNSSFAILPALLNTNAKKIIAPLHWARHNLGIWLNDDNQYPQFTYQDRDGNLHTL